MDSVGIWSANGKGCGYGKSCSPTYPVRGVCPSGWHLPDNLEIQTLFGLVGDENVAGKLLKSNAGWNGSGNGTDVYSFSALPVGHRNGDGGYNEEGGSTQFWSSTEDGSTSAYRMALGDTVGSAYLGDYYKYYGFSVRCLKD